MVVLTVALPDGVDTPSESPLAASEAAIADDMKALPMDTEAIKVKAGRFKAVTGDRA
jgi:hypothetical protein